MSRHVTLDLPDEVMDRVERLATLTHRDIAEILIDAVSVALPVVNIDLNDKRSVAELSDDEVLRLSELQLDATQNKRLSGLLDKQQAGELKEEERQELFVLMQAYEVTLLRQSEMLAEAVRRGLREPLSP